jgi:hypothetical protein
MTTIHEAQLESDVEIGLKRCDGSVSGLVVSLGAAVSF